MELKHVPTSQWYNFLTVVGTVFKYKMFNTFRYINYILQNE